MTADVSMQAPSEPQPKFEANALAQIPASKPTVDIAKFRESEQGKALVDWALGKYTAGKQARETEERDWKKNLAMYNGKQYLQVVRSGQFQGQLMEKPKDPKVDRKVINRTEPLVRTEIARLTSQKPSATVVPASSDDQDMFAAMAGEQVWESTSLRGDFQQVTVDVSFWTSITGNGFFKTYWNEQAIDTDADMMGDVSYECVTPFNLIVADLRETYIEKQPYVINFYTKGIEWIEITYAEELKGVKLNPSVNAANEVIEETYLNLSATQKASPDSCLVYEFWVKPGGCKYLPNGGYFTIVDKTLVAYQESFPYDHSEYPFAHVGHILTGKFYRRSVLNSTNELNSEYNSWRTQLIDARVKMARPQLMAHKGAVSAPKWSNQAGMLIEVRPGFQFPQPIPLTSMPPYVMEEGQSILTDIEDISGQHQVSKGNTPPGVTAATAISYLQEKDDSYLSPTYQSLESACQKVARQTLSLTVQFWDIPRLVKVAGEDKQFDTLTLMGSDIKHGIDIRVEGGSALPTSKAAKQAVIMDLMNMGALTSDQGLEYMEIGGASQLVDQMKTDKRQAQRENVRMKGLTDEMLMVHEQEFMQRQQMGDPSTLDTFGTPLQVPPVITVNTWDNHQAHIDTHNTYRKSQAFLFLSDSVKAQFESHVNMHKQLMQQDQLQQMLASMPTDGSVSGVSGLLDPETGQPVADVGDGSGEGIPGQEQEQLPQGESNGVVGE